MEETQKTGLIGKISNFARKHPKLYQGCLFAILAANLYALYKIETYEPTRIGKQKELKFLEWVSNQKYVQRDGTCVYLEEYWHYTDNNTQKKVFITHVDKDNDGYPEYSFSTVDNKTWITKYSLIEGKLKAIDQ